MILLAATKPDCTAAAVALLFHEHVYQNHGLPKDVVCDRDPVFFSKFWKALTDILKVKIRASSAYHPQTDGQTEIMNKNVEEMLRNFVNHNQSDCVLYLIDVEVAYNRSPNAVTTYSLFFLVYGYEPSTVPADLHCSMATNVASVSEWLQGLQQAQCSISPYYLDTGPGSPADWSVFMWRIELTCVSLFGRLLPSCISVLSFYRPYFGGYSIFMIARSIDPAPFPSDNKSTMGPGFAVVGTPGSPSDVAQTKVLLPRL